MDPSVQLAENAKALRERMEQNEASMRDAKDVSEVRDALHAYRDDAALEAALFNATGG